MFVVFFCRVVHNHLCLGVIVRGYDFKCIGLTLCSLTMQDSIMLASSSHQVSNTTHCETLIHSQGGVFRSHVIDLILRYRFVARQEDGMFHTFSMVPSLYRTLAFVSIASFVCICREVTFSSSTLVSTCTFKLS